MARFILRSKAIEDLTAIWNYTSSQWNERQADRYYRELVDSCQTLADHPAIGKPYDIVDQGLLGLPVNKHIIFYRPLDQDDIEIIRILHGRMDLKRQVEG